MTIKEVSEKYGVTQDTLRYYERVGMIPRVTRTAVTIWKRIWNGWSWQYACAMPACRWKP